MKLCSRAAFLLVLFLLLGALDSAGQEAKDLKLPPPQTLGGMPLMQALKERQTSRDFSAEKLPLQTLSNLLWAADGVNRPDGKRTAPSAVNWQNIDIYVALAEGLYVYDPKADALKLVLEKDVREVTGKQDFVKIVPLDLVYVADFSKITRGTDEDKSFYSAAHTGFISQNVYLYCASAGLSTVVRGLIDKAEIAKVFQLRPDQKVMLSQSVGFPKKK
jgi:SagB-type dehydrogenase family enzyme